MGFKFGRVNVARLQNRISSLGRLLVLTILGCGGAQAADSACGVQVVNLLASGKINALSALFREPSQLIEPLDQLAKHLGAVSGVRAVDAPRFAKHGRLSVPNPTVNHAHAYQGHWINAESERLGPIQFHVAQLNGEACFVAAIHLDIER